MNKSFALQEFDRQDVFKVVLAILTFGLGWIANNQATVISFAAILIVWLLGLALQRFGYRPGKAGLTIIVFLVALGLALLFQPVIMPARPTWTGDAATFAPALILFVSAFLQIASGVVAYATGVYNILLAQVLEKIPAVSKQLFTRRLA